MGKNNKPILSVLVDEDKKEKFAELARRSKYSMAWLLNDCIDRMLAADSIHIYSDSIFTSVGVKPEPPIAMSRTDIEDIIKAYISNYINTSSIGTIDIESITRDSIDVVVQPINRSVEELRSELAEVSEFARNLQGEIVKVKKALGVAAPTENHIDTDPNVKLATKAVAIVESNSEPPETAEVIAKLDRQEKPTPSVNKDWDEALANLVGTGMRSTGIAQKLTEMGYTNSKGGVIDRKSVEQRIARQPELREIYRKPKPE